MVELAKIFRNVFWTLQNKLLQVSIFHITNENTGKTIIFLILRFKHKTLNNNVKCRNLRNPNKCNIILAMNIIIVHSWDVVFTRAKALRKTTPLG
jgi:hypothetical protein